ncbi:hypothetical protein EDB86DRAFT_3063873 [Lactarius hatsudake]|nr:hypothetical protein EDB86DRAFT_3063873 [Lactarius hatsudake]
MDALCPKCRRHFADSRGVLVHLNHKYSSCHNFLDDYDALSAYTEDLQRRTVQCALLASSRNRVPPPPPLPPPPPPPPVLTPPHIDTPVTEYHPRSSFIYEDSHRRATNLYYPFQSREEWGLARFLARSSLSQSEIDEFLKLEWVKLQKPTFTSAHALRSLIESLPDPPRWYCEEMIIEGYESEKITFYWRDALDVIEYIFGNPIFAPYMQYDPQRVWTDISKAERVYSEYMTGDFAWQSQDRLPTGATQLAVVGASDKTCVTAMTGGLEMYPAYLTLANIVSEVRMKASSHAWMCFSFLPIVKFDVHSSFQSILSARLWHACMDKAFVRCKDAAVTGYHMADPCGCSRLSFPLLAAWIADLPEQHLISAMAKSTLPLSCAVTNQFGDAFPHPPRHGQETIKLIQDLTSRVDPWMLDVFQDKAKELSLSGVHLPFWRDWYMADPYHFLVPEILHTCHKFFYDHPLQWCINAISALEFDSRFKSLHPHVGFRHFGNSVTHVKQMTGCEHRDIQRSIVAVIAGTVPPRFLCAIRALSSRRYLPKLEILHHFACSTKMMGVPIQWTADVTERLHITEVKHPFRATNHRNFEEQCTRILDRFLANGNLKHENPAAAEAVLAIEQDPDTAHSLTVTAHEMIITSRRPTANYFLNGFVSSDSLTAFHLNKTPDIASISISDAANLYTLQDFWPALGDFTRGLSHQQRRGRRISRGHPDVGFNHIRVWFQFKIQLRSTHDRHVVVPAQTVQALPLSKKHPQGLCDAVLIHTHGDAGDESFQETQVIQVRMVFQPISREQPSESIHLLLCYVQKFSFAGRRAEDGTRSKEQNVGMYLVRRQFRAPTVGSGERMCMGDITPIIDIAHAVDIVPVYGARMDPRITAENSLDIPTDFYLNDFSDKEIYYTLLSEFS